MIESIGNPMQDILDTTEAADALGVRPGTVRAAIAQGRMSATKRGRDLWILRSEVERYRRECLRKHGPKPRVAV
jgi:excisionase family DNA binding protein